MSVQPIRDEKKITAIRKILSCSAHGSRDEALFILGINTALRIGDLLALTLGDVMDEGRIKKEICLTEKKTGKFRRCPINKAAEESLFSYLRERLDSDKFTSPLDPLFLSRKGGAITRQQAHHILSRAGKDVGLDDIGTHSLRKTFGYHVFTKTGGNLALVQKLLNHSNSIVTLNYIGIDREEMDNTYLDLNLK